MRHARLKTRGHCRFPRSSARTSASATRACPRGQCPPRRSNARRPSNLLGERTSPGGWHAACEWHGAMRAAITLSLPEPAYLRCLRVLGAWWCLGSSALQPRLLMQLRGTSVRTGQRSTHLVAVAATAALTLGACAPAISVRTALSPDASLTGLHTFRVLPTPKPKIAGAVSSTNDPMLVNSISNRALRSDLAQEFAGLGYVASDSNPDFCVAYYASTNQKLDLTYWDYGYAWRPHWWSGWGHRYGRG